MAIPDNSLPRIIDASEGETYYIEMFRNLDTKILVELDKAILNIEDRHLGCDKMECDLNELRMSINKVESQLKVATGVKLYNLRKRFLLANRKVVIR